MPTNERATALEPSPFGARKPSVRHQHRVNFMNQIVRRELSLPRAAAHRLAAYLSITRQSAVWIGQGRGFLCWFA